MLFSSNELSQIVFEADQLGGDAVAVETASAVWIADNRAKVDTWLEIARN